MSESLRNSGRIWVPKSRETAEKIRKKEIKPSDVPEEERDYYLEKEDYVNMSQIIQSNARFVNFKENSENSKSQL